MRLVSVTSTVSPSQDSTLTGSCGCGSVVTGWTWSSPTTAVVGSVSNPPAVVPPVRSGSGSPSASWVTAKPSTGSPQARTGSPTGAAPSSMVSCSSVPVPVVLAPSGVGAGPHAPGPTLATAA